MATPKLQARQVSRDRWVDESARDAAALARRLGAEGVEWLDAFLADYVLVGEPLDRVLVKARRLSHLAPRPRPSAH